MKKEARAVFVEPLERQAGYIQFTVEKLISEVSLQSLRASGITRLLQIKGQKPYRVRASTVFVCYDTDIRLNLLLKSSCL